MSLIKLEHLTKIYKSKENVAIGIQDINLEFNKGEFVAIVGSSGSGKTTLLNVISGMDSYEEGELYIDGKSTSDFTLEDFENYRRANVAFIFQNYQLIDSYTVLENVMIELIFKGFSKKDAKIRAKEILNKVGMGHRLKNRATKLSGGEKQRVVIARAMASDAQILVCDEPTGNLDSKNSIEIMKLLKEIAKDKLVLLVTHDESLIENNATRVVRIKDGKVESDIVISKSEIIEENNLKTAGANKTSTQLYVAFKNIFRTPKKSLFIFVVFVILAFVLLNSAAYIPTTIQEVDTYTVEYQTFVNRDENRIAVFDDKVDEVATEGKMVFEKDYFLDLTYRVGTYSTTLNRFVKKTSRLKATPDNLELIVGEFPKNTDEIVLIMGEILLKDEMEKLIGTEVKISLYKNNIFMPKKYLVSGFASYSKEYLKRLELHKNSSSAEENADEEVYDTTDFYISEQAIKELAVAADETYKKEIVNVCLEDFLFEANNERYSVNLYEFGYKDEQGNQVIRINFRYKDKPYKFKLGLQEVDLSKYKVEYYYTNVTTYTISFGYDIAKDIIENTPYRYSVYDRLENIDSLCASLIENSGNKSSVYAMKDLVKEVKVYDLDGIVENLLYFVFLFVEIIVSLFIVTVITSFVLGTKKKELGVLRVIGLSEKDVLRVLNFELLFMMICAISTTLLVSALSSSIVPSLQLNHIFNSVPKLVVIIVVLLLMSYLISLSWNKKMFKKSAREVLKVGDAL